MQLWKKFSHEANGGRYQMILVLMYCIWRVQSLSGDIEWTRVSETQPPSNAPPPRAMRQLTVKVESLAVWNTLQALLVCCWHLWPRLEFVPGIFSLHLLQTSPGKRSSRFFLAYPGYFTYTLRRVPFFSLWNLWIWKVLFLAAHPLIRDPLKMLVIMFILICWYLLYYLSK